MSWKTVKLGTVINHRKGFITISDSKEYKRCRVQVNRKGVVLRDVVKGSAINTKKQQVCKEGDFLVAEIDAKVGGYGFIGKELEGAIVSSHYFLFEVNEELMLKEYLNWLIKTEIIQDQISSKGSTNYAAIRPAHVLDFEIPLPASVATQQEIVDKLNAIHEEYSALTKELTQQQTYLQLLRQTILQEAVQGKLTQREPTDEPASALLARIKAEKAQLVKAGKLKKEKELPPITEAEMPFALPEGWVWCRLKELGYIMGGGTPTTSKAEYWGGDIPWITPKDMKADYLNDSEEKVTDLGVQNSTAKLIPPFSILVVARSGILKRKLPVSMNMVACVVNQDLKVIVPYYIEMAEYIHLMLKGFESLILNKLVKYGMTVHSLMYQEFEEQLLPIPTLAEQKRILSRIRTIQNSIESMTSQVIDNNTNTNRFLQTILKEAFQPQKKVYGINETLSLAAEA